MLDHRYTYEVELVSAYDGDSVRVNIDLGFGHIWTGRKGKGVRIRLAAINAPELKGEEREKGLESRDELRKILDGKRLLMRSVKDGTGKYGRYLGYFFTVDDEGNIKEVNSYLMKNGFAKPYED